MTDKITKQVLKVVYSLESSKDSLEKKQECLLDAYKEIYTNTVTMEDLIKRRIYLTKSSEAINPALWFFVSTWISLLNFFMNKTNLENIYDRIINIVGSFVMIGFIFFVTFVVYKAYMKYYECFNHYSTVEFEIQLIDEILNEKWNNAFEEIKNEMFRYKMTSFKKEAEGTKKRRSKMKRSHNRRIKRRKY